MLSPSRPLCDFFAVLTASCLYCCLFLALVFFSISCMGRVRPAVVLFYDLPLLMLRLILLLSVLCRTTAPTNIIYISVSIHPVSGSHLVCVFPSSLPRRFVRPLILSCSRFYRMCILLLCLLTPFVVYIFHPTFFSVYISPLDR